MPLLLVRQLDIKTNAMPLVEVPRTPLLPLPKLSPPPVTPTENRMETTDREQL